MTERTLELNELLKSRGSMPLNSTIYSTHEVNDFLKEAYQLQLRITDLLSYLRSIRAPYLSTAPPPRAGRFTGTGTTQSRRRGSGPETIYLSNADRDAIEAESKSVWRDISASVNRLAQAENVRRASEKAVVQQRRRRKGFGALASWAAGGAAATASPEDEEEDGRMAGLSAVRESVVWFLNRGVETAGRVQSGLMEVRIRREMERNKSVLAQSAGGVATMDAASSSSLPPAAAAVEAEPDMAASLSAEQVQLFAEENRNMLKHHQDQLGKVKAVEKSLVEISELQATLATNLQMQSAHIDELVQNSYQSTADVKKGNVELERATQRRSTARMVFWSSIGLCAFLVTWDLVV